MALTLEELKSFYNGKKVLVTGHTGFKGSWLVRILTLAGAQGTGYALNPPTDPNLFEIAGLEDTIHSVVGDVRDLAHLRRVFDEVKPYSTWQRSLSSASPTKNRSTPTRPT